MRSFVVAATLPGAVAGNYALSQQYVDGSKSFFDKFSFWEEPDPSHGSVKYVDRGTAEMTGLISETEDGAFIGVETRSVVGARKSVRVESIDTFNAGLFIAKIDHVPTGCGTWPAFWMYGDDWSHQWPAWGEYDIIEGVHEMASAMTSLHTSSHCDQSDVTEGLDFSSRWQEGIRPHKANNCFIHAPDQQYNQGCSQTGPFDSMGAGFNANGGGTYASEWDPDRGHLRTWFWPVGTEPSDVAMHSPDPDSWGTPYSYFTLTPGRCSKDHLRNFRIVFNVNLCGDLGNAKFAGSCPDIAKSMQCSDFVTTHPERMTEAYWSIRALDVYQISFEAVATTPVGPSLRVASSSNFHEQYRHSLKSASSLTQQKSPSLFHSNSLPSQAGETDLTGSFDSDSNPASVDNNDASSGSRALQANDVVHWLLGLGLLGWISFWGIQLLRMRAQSNGGGTDEVALMQNAQSTRSRPAYTGPSGH